MRRSEVIKLVGLSISGVYAQMARGRFPRPVHFGPGCVRWVEAEVAAWIAARIAERDEGNTGSA